MRKNIKTKVSVLILGVLLLWSMTGVGTDETITVVNEPSITQ